MTSGEAVKRLLSVYRDAPAKARCHTCGRSVTVRQAIEIVIDEMFRLSPSDTLRPAQRRRVEGVLREAGYRETVQT